MRIRKICSRIEDFDRNALKLKQRLLNKHYPEDLVEKSINKARLAERDQLLEEKITTNQKIIPFSVTFHPDLKRIPKILNTHVHLLHENPLTAHFKKHRVLTAYRRGKNLRDLLVRNDILIKEHLPIGAYPCKNKCRICRHIKPTKEVISTDKTYKLTIKTHLSCYSKSVVYMLTCDISYKPAIL